MWWKNRTDRTLSIRRAIHIVSIHYKVVVEDKSYGKYGESKYFNETIEERGKMKNRVIVVIGIICLGMLLGCQRNSESPKKESTKEEKAATAKATKKTTEKKVSSEVEKKEKIRIAVDPGHQKEQMSKQEPIGPGASETKPMVSSGTEGCVTGKSEYQVNLEISMKLKKILMDRGYDVYMIRETNDVQLSNRKRAEMANKSGSKLFLRIHCNSDENSSVYGALTMCPTDSNSYCPDIIKDSQYLARVIGKSLCQKTGAKNRGVIQTDQMSGINWCKIPVTIIETGFMSNPEEDRKLSDVAYQSRLAEGIADGVDIYIKNK